MLFEVLPIYDAMEDQRLFWPTFQAVMAGVVAFFVLFGLAGYSAFGSGRTSFFCGSLVFALRDSSLP